MTIKPGSIISQAEAVNRGFSRQSAIYDEADRNNPVLQDLRHQVYAHVQKFLKPASRILELNAGTGLDALYFVSQGHRIHATDLSDGMISQIKRKIQQNDIASQLTCQQLSYTELDKSSEKGFDYVFSNFGGLNCVRDLSQVTQNLPGLLNDEAYITLVIMPPVSPWELTWVLKGDLQKAVRRLRKEGAVAHLEGEYFKTYYHSLSEIRRSLRPFFELIACESLALVSPPPHCTTFPVKHRHIYNFLRGSDKLLRHLYPFNRCGDHLIATFQFRRR